MRKSDGNQFKVGVFVFLAIVMFLILVIMIGTEKKVFQKRYTLMAHFKEVQGLRGGAPVWLAGVDVGVVEAITFPPEELGEKGVTLKLEISTSAMDRIRKDSVAKISTQGLLGDKLVEITIGSFDEPMLQEGEYITTAEPVQLDEILETGGEILENIKTLSENLSEISDTLKSPDAKSSIKESLVSLKSILNEIEEGDGFVHAMIYDPRSKEMIYNVNDMTEDLAYITGQIRDSKGTLGLLVNDPSLYEDAKILVRGASRSKMLKAVIKSSLERE